MPNCTPLVRQAKPLTIRKLFTAFLIAAGGAIAAMSILIMETIVKPAVKTIYEEEQETPGEAQILFDQMQKFFLSSPHNRRVFSGSIADMKARLKYYKWRHFNLDNNEVYISYNCDRSNGYR